MLTINQNPAVETVYASIVRQGLRQFTVSSPQHGCGNSSIAFAIALRAAESGKRVLLVELNRSSPALAQHLDIETCEWLPLTGHWEHAAQETAFPGLLVLSSPEKSSHCVEFRDQETLKLFFDHIREIFDLVICDAEPLLVSGRRTRDIDGFQTCEESLPVDTICAASAATLLNVLTGRTTESQIDEAREILFQSGAILKGVIMNDQHAPGLKQELIRETYRFERFLPKLMAKVRDRIERSTLLNQEL